MKVFVTNIQGHQVLNYHYTANRYMSFRFHLLCEVGEPWRRQAEVFAQRLAESRNCEIRKVSLGEAPWYVEALVSKRKSK